MDTGRAGTIYSQSAEDLLGKSFFAKHNFLPRGGFKREWLHEIPAPDYEFLDAAVTRTTTKCQTSFSCVGTHVSALQGWNFGANYTKALFILAHGHGAPSKQFMFLHDAQPTDKFGAGAKGIGIATNQFAGSASVGTIAAASGLTAVHGTADCAGYTGLAGVNSFVTITYGEAQGMALYVDTAGGGTVKVFWRNDFAQWMEVASVASAHLAGVIRCASFIGHPNAGGSAVIQMFGGPVGIYAE